MRTVLVVFLLVFALGHTARAQYTKSAGQNAPMAAAPRTVYDKEGRAHTEIVQIAVPADSYGNAQGNQHDLAVDGAFKGQTVAVIQEYVDGTFDFELPRKALAEKGFSTFRWSRGVPTPEDLEMALAKSSQLWVIAGSTPMLTPKHVAIIKKYFEAGHGVYIWGDNDPYYADANVLAEALFGTEMKGDVIGNQVVGVEAKVGGVGLLPNHLLTTGLEHIYEGITIATIKPAKDLQPLIYGSAGNLVAAFYDKDGKRAVLDGGFTRLYNKWDTAGTARYVKNAAAWLANAERFKEIVAVAGESPAAATPVKAIPAIVTAPTTTTTTPTTTMAQPAGVPTALIGAALVAVIAALGFVWFQFAKRAAMES